MKDINVIWDHFETSAGEFDHTDDYVQHRYDEYETETAGKIYKLGNVVSTITQLTSW